MASTAFVGIDLGTSGCKVAAFDKEGHLVSMAREPVTTDSPGPGLAEQSADDWWRAAVRCFRRLRERGALDGDGVRGVGLCGHWPTLALLDSEGKQIRPAVIWRDTRGILPPEIPAEALAWQINLPAPYLCILPVTKLFWMRENEPQSLDPRRLGRCLGSREVVLFRLTGRAATDPVSAWWSGLAGRDGSAWDRALLGRLGISPNCLPDIMPMTSPAGYVTTEAAEATGLPTGIPVAVGTGDGVCGAIGGDILRPGEGVLIYGSSVIVATPVPEDLSFTGDDAIMRFPRPVGTRDLLYTSTPGGSADVFVRNLLGNDNDKASDVHDEAMALPPHGDIPLFVPHVEGISSPLFDVDMRGAWLGLGMVHGWPELYRAVQEGIVFSGRHILDALEAIGAPLQKIRLGGGKAQDAALRQLCADGLGRPVTVLESPEVGCLGAAVLASVAASVYPDPASATAAMVHEVETLEPGPGRAPIEERYGLFCRACAWLNSRGEESVSPVFGERVEVKSI